MKTYRLRIVHVTVTTANVRAASWVDAIRSHPRDWQDRKTTDKHTRAASICRGHIKDVKGREN